MPGSTPSQTVGPFLAIGLPWPDGPDLVAAGTPGAITIAGRLRDGAASPVPDGLIEIWQADPDGRFAHPDDPRGFSAYPGFRGFGRAATDPDGRFAFRTLKPGPLPAGDVLEAPHINVTVFARGLLKHLLTRIYFPDEPTNGTDPVLASLDPAARRALTGVPQGPDRLRFDITLQGSDSVPETPFFVV